MLESVTSSWQLLANSIKKFIPHEKSVTFQCCHCLDFTDHKPFLTLELIQYCKSDSTFFLSGQVATSSDCSRLGNTLCFHCPVRPAQAVLELCLAIDFAVKTFYCLLE